VTDNNQLALTDEATTDQIEQRAAEAASAAYEALSQAYMAIQQGQDPNDALIAVNNQIIALQESHTVAVSVIDGLRAMALEVTDQRDRALEEVRRLEDTMEAEVEERVEIELEWAAEEQMYNIERGGMAFGDPAEIANDYEMDRMADINSQISALRSRGLTTEADELEEAQMAASQSNERLDDLETKFEMQLRELGIERGDDGEDPNDEDADEFDPEDEGV
jgi:hypothetical protein